MPQPRQNTRPDFPGQPPQWMKFAFGIICALMVIVAIFGWEQWEDARRDYATKQHELGIKAEQNAKLQRDVDNVSEFLKAYINDPEFRMRVARQRMQYVAPGEFILKVDPPPRPTVPPENPAPRKP